MQVNKTDGMKLRFTGNWYIDAGIMGFINLMEDVYGWNLEELEKRLEESPEKVYYGYFPVAYVAYIVYFLRGAKDKKNNYRKEELYSEINKKLTEINDKDCESIFDIAWNYIKGKFSEKTNGKERIPITKSGKLSYFTNFLFFQPKWDANKQKKAFEEILGIKKPSSETLIYIDRTVSKFLPSASTAPNYSYTKSFIKIDHLEKILPDSKLVFLITFPIAFVSYGKGENEINLFFYAPDLKFTYEVNKKIKMMIDRVNDKGEILYITWEKIIDTLQEMKSEWTLENMYIIEYSYDSQRQRVFNVEYIGIPKLQASIIIDDIIRKNLNKLIIDDRGEKWILREFISEKPLYPIILNHINLVLSDKISFGISKKNTFLYSLIVEAKIRELAMGKENRLFSPNFFYDYKDLTKKIKEEIRKSSYKLSLIRKVFDADDERRKEIARELFVALKKRNKNVFLNVILKNLNELSLFQNRNKFYIKKLLNWIFEKIVKNDKTFELYGLLIIIYLIM